MDELVIGSATHLGHIDFWEKAHDDAKEVSQQYVEIGQELGIVPSTLFSRQRHKFLVVVSAVKHNRDTYGSGCKTESPQELIIGEEIGLRR